MGSRCLSENREDRGVTSLAVSWGEVRDRHMRLTVLFLFLHAYGNSFKDPKYSLGRLKFASKYAS